MRKRFTTMLLILVMLLGTVTVNVNADIDTTIKTINLRYWGSNRYETSFAVGDELYKSGKFENVVVACGTNFPDALSGGYLTKI